MNVGIYMNSQNTLKYKYPQKEMCIINKLWQASPIPSYENIDILTFLT